MTDGGDFSCLSEGSQPYPRAGPTNANTGGLVFKTPARETPTGKKGLALPCTPFDSRSNRFEPVWLDFLAIDKMKD